MLNVMDLFSGCGGMSLGFKMAGFTSILASDIDENCKLTYSHNFPETPFVCQDILNLDKKHIDQMLDGKNVDIIIGGPPCQGFSLANKKRNKVVDDPRNKLFYEYVRFLDWYNPIAFVMENVKGLLSMHNGQVIQEILKRCSSAGNGYNVDYRVLKASDYGVPQTRERVVIIGIRKDLNEIPQFPAPGLLPVITVDDAISDLPTIEAGEGRDAATYKSAPKNDYQSLMRRHSDRVYNHIAMRHTKRLIERFNAIKHGESLIDVWDTHGAVKRGNPNEKSDVKFSQNNQRLFGNRPSPTIAASFQSNFIHPHCNRNFTAREGARLQSFPDDFIFKGFRTKMSWEKGLSQYQQIGNAVPPLFALAIADSLKASLWPLGTII